MEKVKPNISLTEQLGFKSLAEKTTANVGEQMSYTHTHTLLTFSQAPPHSNLCTSSLSFWSRDRPHFHHDCLDPPLLVRGPPQASSFHVLYHDTQHVVL